MKIYYEDDKHPATKGKYANKTIGQILETHPHPDKFIRAFNTFFDRVACISDEIMIDQKRIGCTPGLFRYRTNYPR